ncbi:exosortase/archaeosortase family protein [Subsaximicrobium wynnwilliamsii]|uniref:Exosortase/archaeosortase family protein n=1 Tax=Subsaximicrobium wynnwilliamsii TaxID=291179 RepID=A0A5C6ZHR1_9FLAO|nr:exosortase/archaeosortase family protein [Subsaximicrobium wynnwilliamsii]TXD82958.1 exosortase/archaeosortase family protein [Subsaximicrobium wynnwilliamsii]TXD88679.1 exosortase/archaeosortase family protein [Subsaximicrobium wynnwilliamsii]TXE02772.1 exosortase/archaeosortase family protein [Subsaximicrobium wynnwilliamsii]
MFANYWRRGVKQKIISVLVIAALIIALFVLRDDYQPVLLFVRKYIFVILLSLIVLFFGLRAFRNSASTGRRLGILALLITFFALIYLVGWHLKFYDYMKTYNVFNDLNKVEINELPLTQNERIQPLRNIYSMANESVGETKDVSLPHLVRVDNENKWTMAIQPSEKYSLQQIRDDIEEVFSVSSTSPFPRFSAENRIPVIFSIGESLKFSRNTYNAVVQRFNPWMLINYEPGDTFYMKNDSGEWVEVVSLIKWKGFFFPYPSFGGVMVIESGEHDFNDYLERIAIGKGKYISPDELKNYPYLTKQNTLAQKVSRLQAESLKFLGGFSDPLPWNMETAVKIPNLASDQNQQPFVTDFDFAGSASDAYSGLYHWFGLEPIGAERTSLSFSVFVPADGTDKLYYYDHAAKKQGYAGVSAMPLKVIESRKEFDWSVNKPVEFRPYIKDIAGRRRLFFLGTISAIRESNAGQFDGAATPDLALIDSEYRDVVWIDVKHPSTWDQAIYDQLNEAWRASEGIGYFYENAETDEDLMIQNAVDSIMAVPSTNRNTEEIDRLQKRLDSLKSAEPKE